MVLKKITDNIVKSNNDSNIYYIKDINLIIDAGNRMFKAQFKEDLQDIVDFEKVETVILTHLHFDHIGCFDLFPNAKFYTSRDGIEIFKNEKLNCVLDRDIAKKFNVRLHDIKDLKLPSNYKVISTPGHCVSCLSIYDEKDKILYSGDTLFFKGMVGRHDLPTSSPQDLQNSLKKLEELDYDILCPGHDY